MTMNKKKLAIVSLVLCVLAVISMGSLAWFTATETLDNTLTFITDFSMDLYETDPETGEAIAEDATGVTYEDLKPGDTIDKDPTVVNMSTDESMWIMMTVEVENGAAWGSVVPEGSDLTAIFGGYVDDLWAHPEDPTIDAATGNYVAKFYLKSALDAGDTATLFTSVSIPEDMTLEDATTLAESHIYVTADAMQIDAGEDVLSAFGVGSSSDSEPASEPADD